MQMNISCYNNIISVVDKFIVIRAQHMNGPVPRFNKSSHLSDLVTLTCNNKCQLINFQRNKIQTLYYRGRSFTQNDNFIVTTNGQRNDMLAIMNFWEIKVYLTNFSKLIYKYRSIPF